MKDKEKPRISRLTAILTQLQSKRLITAKYLAEKHQVSIRTIYRDIRTLEQSGIPIITEEGKGYSLMEGFQLAPVQFTEDEANALITAEQLVLGNKDHSFRESYSNAVTKIKSVLRYSQKEKVDFLADRIFIRTAESDHESSTYVMKIQSAITNFQVLQMEYCSLSQKTTKRDIEPFAMYSTKGKWLLIAFCRLRQEFRVFRIDLIKRVTPVNKTFEPHNLTMEQFFKDYIQKS